jgi:hypothetical protein
MTKRKFDKYTLWLKWGNLGWRPAIVIVNLPWPAENPRKVLENWASNNYPSRWPRSDWMILGGDKTPVGYKKD